MERRATKRFRAKLPITVRWRYLQTVREAQTQSEDISSRGVYFFLPTEIKKGSSVELVVFLSRDITLADPIRVRCYGHVQRAEMKALNRVGLAIEIERYAFLRD
jgi:PilZ domain